MKAITILLAIATGALSGAAWYHRVKISDLETAAGWAAACPLPPINSEKSLIVNQRAAKDGTEVVCMHGRIRPADPRPGPLKHIANQKARR